MWWKIYFWFTIVEVALQIFGLFTLPGDYIATQVVTLLIFVVAVVGLYSYVFQKKLLNEVFWQYLLGIYILMDAVFLLYIAFPKAPLISSLSFLAVYKDTSLPMSFIGVFVDIPLLYAIYRLTKGDQLPSKQKLISDERKRWGMLQTAIWGYSIVLVFILFIMSFIPTASSTVTHREVSDGYYVSGLFAPLLLFWLWILIEFKRYKWNWWKTTLAANGILYSGSIIASILIPQSQQITDSGIDILSMLQLLILLLGLWVFGREQFAKIELNKGEKGK